MLEAAEARALVTTSLSDTDLEAVIAREEAWLARRIGPLDGERVETFVSADGDEVLRLTRPATEVSVSDDGGETTDFEVRGWGDVVPGTEDVSHSWAGDVVVTYTPDDADEVKRVLISCLRLTLAESGYTQQSAGGYSASVDSTAQRAARFALWRSLLRPRYATTTRLRSAIPFGGKSIGPVGVEAVAGS